MLFYYIWNNMFADTLFFQLFQYTYFSSFLCPCCSLSIQTCYSLKVLLFSHNFVNKVLMSSGLFHFISYILHISSQWVNIKRNLIKFLCLTSRLFQHFHFISLLIYVLIPHVVKLLFHYYLWNYFFLVILVNTCTFILIHFLRCLLVICECVTNGK